MDEKMKRELAGFNRREFLKMSTVGLGTMTLVACAPTVAATAEGGTQAQSSKQAKDSYKMSFIQVQPHTVSTAWGQEKMGEMMGGKGNVVILNAPPGIIIRDMRTNGFVEGMKAKYPNIQIIADQSADWDRKKAQDVLSTILASGKEVNGVYGVNDSMALGAMDVAKAKNLLGKMVIFGNDGEKAALESIEAGEMSGTQYTDVWQQGRLAAALAIGLATGGVSAKSFTHQGHILMPYVIATKENVASIQDFQRW